MSDTESKTGDSVASDVSNAVPNNVNSGAAEKQNGITDTSFMEDTSVSVVKDAIAHAQDDEMCSWEPYGVMTKAQFNRRVWRNIILLSLAFMLNYISYGGLSNLQSSLHVQEGTGCTTGSAWVQIDVDQ